MRSEPLDGLDPADPWATGDGQDWLGDVSVGVQAWTRGSDRDAESPAKRSRRKRSRAAAPSEDVATAVPEADPESVARKILLDQLTGQARSRKELAEKLATKLVPEEIATRLLDRFEEVGLIDDAAFARLWVSSRQSGKGLARRALAQELRRKGIADSVAREALDEVDPAAEEESARELVRKKLRSMSRLDEQTKTRRLVAMLARKGYPSGLVMTVVRQAVREDASQVPESLP